MREGETAQQHKPTPGGRASSRHSLRRRAALPMGGRAPSSPGPGQTRYAAPALPDALTRYMHASATATAASADSGDVTKVMTPMLKVTGQPPRAMASSSTVLSF